MNKAAQPKGTRPDLLDINILPREYQRKGIPWRAILPWLLLTVLASLLIPTGRAYLVARSRHLAAEQQLALAQSALEEFEPFIERKEALEQEIETVHSQAAQIEAAAQDAAIERIRWSEILSLILASAPEGLTITEYSQMEAQIVIQGTADHHMLPLTFADALTNADPVNSAIIESLDRFSPRPPEGEDFPDGDPPSQYRFEITLEIQP